MTPRRQVGWTSAARRAIQFLIRLSQGLGGLGVMAFHSTRFGSAYDTLLN
jgi:hypothetical protein